MSFHKVVQYNPITKIIQKILKQSKLLSDFVDYFSNLFCKNCPTNLGNVLFATGVLSVTFSALHFLFKQYRNWKWVPSHYANRKTVNKEDLIKRYGKGHVVITGGAQGIGYAYAEILAPIFDLILVEINEEKLNTAVHTLKQQHPQCDIISIVGDLSHVDGINAVATKLRQLIQRKVQISMLINNAGMSGGGPLFDVQASRIKAMANCNFKAAFILNRELIPYFKRRQQRGAIINMASSTGVFFSPYVGIYSSTKNLVDIYSRTLSIENNNKIDIISCRPFGVTTSMMKMKKASFMITPRDCALSTLADLGKTHTTFSGFDHKVAGSFVSQMSHQAVCDYFGKEFKKR